MEFGSLVRSHKNNLGIGKVTEVLAFEAEVEYFCSVGQRITKTLPLNSLYQVKLQRQTRCYVWSDEDTWLIGRIFAWDEEELLYQIDLPERRTHLAMEAEVYVRCDIPITEPSEILAMKGQETPYFHDKRLAFVQCMIAQRAVSRGMTGLISANIELYPHQVEVVRRVLEDPVQRYLLADEVGLGKTIEAGVIIRQYLLDEPQGLVVVLVPEHLVSQWRLELESKFYASHFPDQVKVWAYAEASRIKASANIGMLLIDEAHNIAALATGDADQQKSFAVYKRLAHKSDRLLLLSATPVLHHEQDFLAMLHLLDPVTYQLDDLAGFRTRIENRSTIGRILLSFKEGAEAFVLTSNLKQLRQLFTEDRYLLELAEKLETALKTESTDSDQLVRAIRTQISDTYRLHRRMLRNRRDAVEDVIFERKLTPKVEYELDERSPDIHSSVEEWRKTAPQEQPYAKIFLLLFRASGTWLGILEQLITSRISGVAHPELTQGWESDEIRVLLETPTFAGETEILQSLLTMIRTPSEDGDRLELLRIVLLYRLADVLGLQSFRGNLTKLLDRVQQRLLRPIGGDKLPKIVIFTNFGQTCAEITKGLINTFGKDSIASLQSHHSRSQTEKSLTQFKTNPSCFILVCDPAGEEGHNFQFAESMIHFDLPWSPNRLEQRIGRSDRIHRQQHLDITVFLGADLEDSPHDAWYRLLKDGFGIFDQSIASLQFYAEQKLPALETALFQSGAEGLLKEIEPIQQEIAAEQISISEQSALDEIDASVDSATEYFQDLDDYDARHKEMKRATEGWICDALQFKSVDDPNIRSAQRYQPTSRTLVPIDDLRNHFAPDTEEFGTYNRRAANQNRGVKLYRTGEGFVESLSQHVSGDDRGQAFAMWRHDPSWGTEEEKEWFGFRFNYVVTADLANATQELIDYGWGDSSKKKILQRRADGLFPPKIETIFIDARSESMSMVTEPALLEILQRPYQHKGGSQWRDYNLAKERLPILDHFVDASKWEDVCRQSRQISAELLSQRPDFQDLCQKFAGRAQQKLANQLEQLRLRYKRQADKVLAEELKLETILSTAMVEGIRHPQIALDSVGFIVVSRQPPVSLATDADE